MCLGSIDAIEQVAIEVIVEFAIEGFTEVLSTRPQDLVMSKRRPLLLALDHLLLSLAVLRWRCEVSMSIEIVFLKFDGLDGHGLNFFEVRLVV